MNLCLCTFKIAEFINWPCNYKVGIWHLTLSLYLGPHYFTSQRSFIIIITMRMNTDINDVLVKNIETICGHYWYVLCYRVYVRLCTEIQEYSTHCQIHILLSIKYKNEIKSRINVVWISDQNLVKPKPDMRIVPLVSSSIILRS